MIRRLTVLFGVLGLLVAACGDDDTDVAVDDPTTTEAPESDETTTTEAPDPDETTTTEAPAPDADRPDYTGGFEVDYDSGDVDVSSYAEFLAEHGAPSTGPEGAALEMLGDRYAESLDMGTDEQVESTLADGGRTVVTVIYDGLPDDSVAAERYELVFIGEGDEMIIESGSWASRCQPDRGHQDWAIGTCL